jgi:NAD(P)-dependent dehydrogenase (short-subunit alcohol dehydrogenase family)
MCSLRPGVVGIGFHSRTQRGQIMKVTFEGKIALVTGGGFGIGKAIAEAFSSLGAKLVIADISPEKCERLRAQFKKDGVEALVVETDVTKVDQVNALKKKIEDKFGRIDILVNNVGHHLGIFKPLIDSTEAEWEALYDVNLKHMFIVTRAMIPLLKKSGQGGNIINLSSIEGFRACPTNAIYTTMKHAVTGFTRTMALELAIDNIRVNLIGPETTDSEQVPIDKIIPPENRAKANFTLPLNRFGRPEDSAWAAVYLASDNASWITGQCILVDGGGQMGNIWQRVPPNNRWSNIPYITQACNVRLKQGT